MNSKLLYSLAAAASAVFLNAAFVTPVHAQAKAALTRDIDRPSAQPVNNGCDAVRVGSIESGCRLYTVPAGKRLVVEFVGYELAAQTIFRLTFGQEAGLETFLRYKPNTFHVPATLTTVGSFTGSQALKIYLDEGQALIAKVIQGDASSSPGYFNFSGYLIDK